MRVLPHTTSTQGAELWSTPPTVLCTHTTDAAALVAAATAAGDLQRVQIDDTTLSHSRVTRARARDDRHQQRSRREGLTCCSSMKIESMMLRRFSSCMVCTQSPFRAGPLANASHETVPGCGHGYYPHCGGDPQHVPSPQSTQFSRVAQTTRTGHPGSRFEELRLHL